MREATLKGLIEIFVKVLHIEDYLGDILYLAMNGIRHLFEGAKKYFKDTVRYCLSLFDYLKDNEVAIEFERNGGIDAVEKLLFHNN